MDLASNFDFKRNALNKWSLIYQNKDTNHGIIYNGKVYTYSFDEHVFVSDTLELAKINLIMDYLEYCQDD